MGAMHAPVERPADHQAHADAGADVDERERASVPAMAMLALGEGRCIHVVLDHELGAERLAQLGHDGRPAQTGQLAGHGDGIPARIVNTWAADHRLGNGRPGDARGAAQLIRESDQLSHPPACARTPPDVDL
jgi:hypothetical protein